ncbi:MAG: pilus assembly protein, partial [Chloroflexi bacterium]|nr:pilus assembly protein [Chloroflexota bacterium]
MQRRSRMSWRRISGQAIVELTLLLPVLLLILLLVIDLGRAYQAYIAVTAASREGARVGSKYAAPDAGELATVTTAIQAAVVSSAGDLSIPNLPSHIVVTYPTTVAVPTPDTVIVTVRYDFRGETPIVRNFFPGGTLTLESSTTLPIIPVKTTPTPMPTVTLTPTPPATATA